jgi:anti-anti-sigma factor
MRTTMKWITQWHERYSVLRFEGDLMVGASEFFETGVMPWLKVPFTPIILDLSDLKIIASAGLSSLVRIQNAASEADIHIVMVKPTPEAWKTLVMTRLNSLFPCADTVEEAVQLVTGTSA